MSQKVTVDAGALQMVINALRKDAEEGKVVRGEMADELLKTIIPVTEQKESYGGNKSPEQLITYYGTTLSLLIRSQGRAITNPSPDNDNLRASLIEVAQGIVKAVKHVDLTESLVPIESLPGPDMILDSGSDPYFRVDTILDYLVNNGLITETQRIVWREKHLDD